MLYKNEQKEWDEIRKAIKGTPIKAKLVGPANVTIFGPSVKGGITKQLGGNVGLSGLTIAKANVSVWRKDLKRAKKR